MKKTILMLSAVALICITACKNTKASKAESLQAENSAVPEKNVSETSGVTIDGVPVPKFSNPEVQEFATEYATMVSEMAAASKAGDVPKSLELTEKSKEWTAQHANWSSKMTSGDSKLWTDFIAKLSEAQRED
ncbi:hypothetical protein [Chryseobacterium chendengshani]|uniref:hypothetical protein n=1 Tax=Chryseobacterium sp. LJ756 TaxID=2864113 RepID=UPI001C63E2F8|nr:hypothetical protein [Chryseobacterium sp. LJ756]MBW7676266.1 hypothetical protein [Chryseobacterium sp. LJ756]